MSSLVNEFIINPVLRQARRFSEVSRSTLGGATEEAITAPNAVLESDHEDNAPHHSDDANSNDGIPTPHDMRPLSSSTQDTRVEEMPAGPADGDVTPHDHLGFPLSPPRKSVQGIPEDDGMRTMRSRIQEINSRQIPQSAKARLMHDALLERYRASRERPDDKAELAEAPLGQIWEPSSSPSGTLDALKFWQNQLVEGEQMERFFLTESDKMPTFAPIRRSKSAGPGTGTEGSAMEASITEVLPPLGCQHYERNVKLECFTCKKWYTCRFCHDAAEDHTLIRKKTKHMLCMLCTTPQKASELCINCGEVSATYYCNICKLWENRQSKPIYHCADCGICRRGLGLGKDFFHCKVSSAICFRIRFSAINTLS